MEIYYLLYLFGRIFFSQVQMCAYKLNTFFCSYIPPISKVSILKREINSTTQLFLIFSLSLSLSLKFSNYRLSIFSPCCSSQFGREYIYSQQKKRVSAQIDRLEELFVFSSWHLITSLFLLSIFSKGEKYLWFAIQQKKPRKIILSQNFKLYGQKKFLDIYYDVLELSKIWTEIRVWKKLGSSLIFEEMMKFSSR
jgi:hypothetical protein